MPCPKKWNLWTELELDKIREGIAKGWSASIIALASLPGRNRNSVIGACFRNGLKLPNKPAGTLDKGVTLRREKARERYREAQAAVRPDSGEAPPLGTTTLLQLEDGSCRWPYGEAAPYLFCGQLVYHNSYCLYHAVMATRPMRERVR